MRERHRGGGEVRGGGREIYERGSEIEAYMHARTHKHTHTHTYTHLRNKKPEGRGDWWVDESEKPAEPGRGSGGR